MSPEYIMRRHGIVFKFKRAKQVNFVQAGRSMLSKLRVSPKCTLFIEMMENWKMRVPRSGETNVGSVPEHSEHSHIGTGYYYFAYNFNKSPSSNTQPQRKKRFMPSPSGVTL
jgi:hypothetical protein